MRNDPEAAMRRHIGALLAQGLATQTEPYPEHAAAVAVLLAEVRELPADDLPAKLVLAGVTDKPHGDDQLRCQECMYYLVHRKWCNLPEMALPVEPEWWCRLWRI